MTFSARNLLALVVLSAVGALAACGDSDSGSGSGSGDAAPLTPVSTDVADLVLTTEDAPGGFSHLDIGGMLAGQAADGDDVFDTIDQINAGNSTDPAECVALQPNQLTVIAQISDRPGEIAVAEFTAADDPGVTVIDALVSTTAGEERLPADLSGCGSFTTTFTDVFTGEGGETSYTLNSETSAAQIEGVEDARIITVTADEGAPETWEPVNIVDGSIGDVYFRVTGHGNTDPQMLVGVAQTQVDRIAGR
ncbi:hypothetical protein [uncultured Corynebacterium sp.]|uniref:hypothetical protein n=1 Tax=uncultured Corynebacterium sp. TaxID=159447 RepID=UPI0025E559CF|nr:hypothetical protein [uncultured Corynebacterium sp.]